MLRGLRGHRGALNVATLQMQMPLPGQESLSELWCARVRRLGAALTNSGLLRGRWRRHRGLLANKFAQSCKSFDWRWLPTANCSFLFSFVSFRFVSFSILLFCWLVFRPAVRCLWFSVFCFQFCIFSFLFSCCLLHSISKFAFAQKFRCRATWWCHMQIIENSRHKICSG